nr:unnamed protein product [Digitaria exilis]
MAEGGGWLFGIAGGEEREAAVRARVSRFAGQGSGTSARMGGRLEKEPRPGAIRNNFICSASTMS